MKKTMVFLLVLFMCLCTTAVISGQDTRSQDLVSPEIPPDQDSTELIYWKAYNEGWTLQPYLSYKTFTFSLRNNENGAKITYVPNVSLNIGLRTVYKGYGIGLSTAIPKAADPVQGESEYTDFQFMLPFGKHGFDFIFQQYHGFYIDDPDLQDIFGNFRQYPGLVTQMISFNYFYAFNPDFSLKAGFNQTSRQLENAGSWLLMGSLNLFIMVNGSSIIPLEEVANFTEIPGLETMWFTGLGISGGYAHSFVKEDWFLTAGIFIGTNIETQSYTLSSGTYEQSVPLNPKTNIKISAGNHNDERYYGVSLLIDNTGATSANILVNTNSLNLSFFAGWRL